MKDEYKRKKKNKGVKRKQWAHNRWFRNKGDGAEVQDEGDEGKKVVEVEEAEVEGGGGSSASNETPLNLKLGRQLESLMKTHSFDIPNPRMHFDEDDDDDEEEEDDKDNDRDGGVGSQASASEIAFVGWAKQVKAEYKVKKELAAKEKEQVDISSLFPEVCYTQFLIYMFEIFAFSIAKHVLEFNN